MIFALRIWYVALSICPKLCRLTPTFSIPQDICYDNVVTALPRDVPFHSEVVPRRVYLIDFNTSKRLTLGPGAQPAITLPPTQTPPPHGLKHFDPYSWDMYCLGRLLQDVMKVGWQLVCARILTLTHYRTTHMMGSGLRG